MTCATVDYERLAWLIDSLGITPDRLEAAVHEIIRTQDRDGLARLTTVEHRLLYYALGEGLVDLRREQDSALRGIGQIEKAGLIERHAVQSDRRVQVQELSRKGLDLMAGYF